jgi:lysophospholipase L1-like esterase
MARRLLLAIPAVPLATAAFLLLQVRRAAHRTDLPSFPNRDASGLFGDPASPPLRFTALGDSSLTGPGLDDMDSIWVRRLASHFAIDHFVELISLGVGGSRIQDVIDGQLEEAVTLRPDIALVTVGANDAIRATPASAYRAAMTHIVTRLEESAGSIVLMGVGDLGAIARLPYSLRPYLSWRARVLDDICASIAVSRPTTVKVYTRGRISTAFWDDRSLFAADMFHAADEGHRVFAEEALPTFQAAYAIASQRAGAAV